MISVRLPKDLEDKLQDLSEKVGTTKTDIVTKALKNYIEKYEKELTPYKLGEDLFGSAGTGDPDTSTTYKQKVGEEINGKYSEINN